MADSSPAAGSDRSSRPVWLGEDKRRWDHVRIHLQVLHDARLDCYTITTYLGLAAHAEIQSGAARPSMDTLAAYGQMSPRKVASCVQRLVDAGYVEVEHRPGKASRYHLLAPPPLHEVQGSGRDPRTVCVPPLHEVPRTPARGADEQEPVNENQERENPSAPEGAMRVEASLAAGFDEFWTAYPRKTAKGEARKAWPAAVKAAGSMGAVITGAQRYAADPNREPRYTAHPATWLRAERWGDEALPARAGQPGNVRRIDQDRGGPAGRVAL